MMHHCKCCKKAHSDIPMISPWIIDDSEDDEECLKAVLAATDIDVTDTSLSWFEDLTESRLSTDPQSPSTVHLNVLDADSSGPQVWSPCPRGGLLAARDKQVRDEPYVTPLTGRFSDILDMGTPGINRFGSSSLVTSSPSLERLAGDQSDIKWTSAMATPVHANNSTPLKDSDQAENTSQDISISELKPFKSKVIHRKLFSPGLMDSLRDDSFLHLSDLDYTKETDVTILQEEDVDSDTVILSGSDGDRTLLSVVDNEEATVVVRDQNNMDDRLVSEIITGNEDVRKAKSEGGTGGSEKLTVAEKDVSISINDDTDMASPVNKENRDLDNLCLNTENKTEKVSVGRDNEKDCVEYKKEYVDVEVGKRKSGKAVIEKTNHVERVLNSLFGSQRDSGEISASGEELKHSTGIKKTNLKDDVVDDTDGLLTRCGNRDVSELLQDGEGKEMNNRVNDRHNGFIGEVESSPDPELISDRWCLSAVINEEKSSVKDKTDIENVGLFVCQNSWGEHGKNESRDNYEVRKGKSHLLNESLNMELKEERSKGDTQVTFRASSTPASVKSSVKSCHDSAWKYKPVSILKSPFTPKSTHCKKVHFSLSLSLVSASDTGSGSVSAQNDSPQGIQCSRTGQLECHHAVDCATSNSQNRISTEIQNKISDTDMLKVLHVNKNYSENICDDRDLQCDINNSDAKDEQCACSDSCHELEDDSFLSSPTFLNEVLFSSQSEKESNRSGTSDQLGKVSSIQDGDVCDNKDNLGDMEFNGTQNETCRKSFNQRIEIIPDCDTFSSGDSKRVLEPHSSAVEEREKASVREDESGFVNGSIRNKIDDNKKEIISHKSDVNIRNNIHQRNNERQGLNDNVVASAHCSSLKNFDMEGKETVNIATINESTRVYNSSPLETDTSKKIKEPDEPNDSFLMAAYDDSSFSEMIASDLSGKETEKSSQQSIDTSSPFFNVKTSTPTTVIVKPATAQTPTSPVTKDLALSSEQKLSLPAIKSSTSSTSLSSIASSTLNCSTGIPVSLFTPVDTSSTTSIPSTISVFSSGKSAFCKPRKFCYPTNQHKLHKDGDPEHDSHGDNKMEVVTTESSSIHKSSVASYKGLDDDFQASDVDKEMSSIIDEERTALKCQSTDSSLRPSEQVAQVCVNTGDSPMSSTSKQIPSCKTLPKLFGFARFSEVFGTNAEPEDDLNSSRTGGNEENVVVDTGSLTDVKRGQTEKVAGDVDEGNCVDVAYQSCGMVNELENEGKENVGNGDEFCDWDFFDTETEEMHSLRKEDSKMEREMTTEIEESESKLTALDKTNQTQRFMNEVGGGNEEPEINAENTSEFSFAENLSSKIEIKFGTENGENLRSRNLKASSFYRDQCRLSTENDDVVSKKNGERTIFAGEESKEMESVNPGTMNSNKHSCASTKEKVDDGEILEHEEEDPQERHVKSSTNADENEKPESHLEDIPSQLWDLTEFSQMIPVDERSLVSRSFTPDRNPSHFDGGDQVGCKRIAIDVDFDNVNCTKKVDGHIDIGAIDDTSVTQGARDIPHDVQTSTGEMREAINNMNRLGDIPLSSKAQGSDEMSNKRTSTDRLNRIAHSTTKRESKRLDSVSQGKTNSGHGLIKYPSFHKLQKRGLKNDVGENVHSSDETSCKKMKIEMSSSVSTAKSKLQSLDQLFFSKVTSEMSEDSLQDGCGSFESSREMLPNQSNIEDQFEKVLSGFGRKSASHYNECHIGKRTKKTLGKQTGVSNQTSGKEMWEDEMENAFMKTIQYSKKNISGDKLQSLSNKETDLSHEKENFDVLSLEGDSMKGQNFCLKSSSSLISVGFSTAAGKTISISDSAKCKAEKVMEDVDEEFKKRKSLVHSDQMMDSQCQRSEEKENIFEPNKLSSHENKMEKLMASFQTAGGKEIQLSEAAKKKADSLWEAVVSENDMPSFSEPSCGDIRPGHREKSLNDELLENTGNKDDLIHGIKDLRETDSGKKFQLSTLSVKEDKRHKGFRPFVPPKVVKKTEKPSKDGGNKADDNLNGSINKKEEVGAVERDKQCGLEKERKENLVQKKGEEWHFDDDYDSQLLAEIDLKTSAVEESDRDVFSEQRNELRLDNHNPQEILSNGHCFDKDEKRLVVKSNSKNVSSVIDDIKSVDRNANCEGRQRESLKENLSRLHSTDEFLEETVSNKEIEGLLTTTDFVSTSDLKDYGNGRGGLPKLNGFATASGRKVSVSEKVLIHARQFFTDNDKDMLTFDEASHLERCEVTEDKEMKGGLTLQDTKISFQVQDSVNEKAVPLLDASTDMNGTTDISDKSGCSEMTKKLTDVLGEEVEISDKRSHGEDDIVTFDPNSEVSKTHTNQHQRCTSDRKGKSFSSQDDSESLDGNGDTESEDGAGNKNFPGFSAVSEQIISVSRETLDHAKAFLNQDESTSKNVDAENDQWTKLDKEKVLQNSNKSGPVKKKAENSKAVIGDVSQSIINSHGCCGEMGMVGFRTALGVSVNVTEKSLEQARLFLNSDEDKDMIENDTIQEMSGKGKVQSGHGTDFGGFSTASGLEVSVSAKALRKAKEFLASDDVRNDIETITKDVATSSPLLTEKNSLVDEDKLFLDGSDGDTLVGSVRGLNSCHRDKVENNDKRFDNNSFGFCTAAGSKVSVSEKSLEKAKSFLNDGEEILGDDSDRGLKKNSEDDKVINTKSGGISFGGFSTASGSDVFVSKKSLQKAKLFLNDEEEQTGFNKELHDGKGSKNFGGFSTASGTDVFVLEKSLKKAKAFLNVDDEVRVTSESGGRDVDDSSGKIGSAGFSTASGLDVAVSNKAVERAQVLLDMTEERTVPAKDVDGIGMMRSKCGDEGDGSERRVQGHKLTDFESPITSHGSRENGGMCSKRPLISKCEEVLNDRSGIKRRRLQAVHSKDLIGEHGDGPDIKDRPLPKNPSYSHSKPTLTPNPVPTNSATTNKAQNIFIPPPSTASSKQCNKKPTGLVDENQTTKCPIFLSNIRRNNMQSSKVKLHLKNLTENDNSPAICKNSRDKSKNDYNEIYCDNEGNPEEHSTRVQGSNVCSDGCKDPGEVESPIQIKGSKESGLMKPGVDTSVVKMSNDVRGMAVNDLDLDDEEENRFLCENVSSQIGCVVLEYSAGGSVQDRMNGRDCSSRNYDCDDKCRDNIRNKDAVNKDCHTSNESYNASDIVTGVVNKTDHHNRSSSINKSDPPDAVWMTSLIEAKMKQDKVIKDKKRRKIAPCCGRLLDQRKATQNNRETMKSLEGWFERQHTRDELVHLGVSETTLSVCSENASDFRFDLRRFYPEIPSSVLVGDGACLVPDERGFAGWQQFYKSFLTLDGVDPKLVDEAWIKNHYRWIVWKLAAYEVCFPLAFAGRCLTPHMVMFQLKYRCDREIDKAQRSAIKKIVEKDDVASKRMVLCVSGRKKEDSGQVLLELTDGWYSIWSKLDKPLCDLVARSRLAIGVKIVTSGAELNGVGQGCAPLEMGEEARLSIRANSTRPAPGYAKLGFHPHPVALCVPLSSLHPDGGVVGCVDVVVTRIYPLMFMEKLREGGCVFRTREEDEEERKKKEGRRETEIERIYQSLQAKMEEEEDKNKTKIKRRGWSRKEVESLNTGDELLDAWESSFSQEDFQFLLSEDQMMKLMEHRRVCMEGRQERMNRRVKDALNEQATHQEHKVTPVLKLRIAGCSTSDIDSKCGTLLTVWRPTAEWSEIQEGQRQKMFNLNVSASRWNQRICKVVLATTRQTRIQGMKIEENLLDLVYEPRELLSVRNVQSMCRNGQEFDFLGVALKVELAGGRGQPTVVVAADRHGDRLVINLWKALMTGSPPVKENDCFVALNLCKSQASVKRSATVSVTAEARQELSSFSTSTHSKHGQALAGFHHYLAVTPEFLERCRRQLNTEVGDIITTRTSDRGLPLDDDNSGWPIEDYDEDFPPEIVEKIFNHLSPNERVTQENYNPESTETKPSSLSSVLQDFDACGSHTVSQTASKIEHLAEKHGLDCDRSVHSKPDSVSEFQELNETLELECEANRLNETDSLLLHDSEKSAGYEVIKSDLVPSASRQIPTGSDPCLSVGKECSRDSVTTPTRAHNSTALKSLKRQKSEDEDLTCTCKEGGGGNEDDFILRRKKQKLRAKMTKLMAYGRPSALSPLPGTIVSPACVKQFKSPHTSK